MEQHYKPLLGNRLEFPADWVGVEIVINDNGCRWACYTRQRLFEFLVSQRKPGEYYFYSWYELQQALQDQERENRQLHVIADLISWHCAGPGTPGLPDPQLQLEL